MPTGEERLSPRRATWLVQNDSESAEPIKLVELAYLVEPGGEPLVAGDFSSPQNTLASADTRLSEMEGVDGAAGSSE
ncbi:hypothetical protein NDU88_004046 [Pleurodeles waltl]|uniref:Uncharacterized protein n=1 Tax=Pleurodeles waltl TaxID=8319 RepID=A0AAV7PBB4_PLEWA|nr:hypothetical protein NDU88_004046 [Pleurodeles waltl]